MNERRSQSLVYQLQVTFVLASAMALPHKKVILITGGSSGLGFETVKALIQTNQPYHIFLGCLFLAEGENAVLSLQRDIQETPSTLEPVSVDATNDESIERCFHSVQSTIGRLDVLISNAGKILALISTHRPTYS